jgi:hypothetical protein
MRNSLCAQLIRTLELFSRLGAPNNSMALTKSIRFRNQELDRNGSSASREIDFARTAPALRPTYIELHKSKFAETAGTCAIWGCLRPLY